MKLNKSEAILQSIIEAYLKAKNPVGSSSLQELLSVPASTIRVYFKQLDERGLLSKAHASSGRIPTVLAMKNYWYAQISEFLLDGSSCAVLDNSAFFKLINKMQLFCMLIDERESYLQDVVSIKNKYLFVEFSDFNVVLVFDESLNHLFCELIGCDLSGVIKVLKRLHLQQIASKIAAVASEEKCFFYGKERFFNMCASSNAESLLNSSLLNSFSTGFIAAGLLKPEFLGFKINCAYKNLPISALICGPVYKNYNELLSTLKEVV